MRLFTPFIAVILLIVAALGMGFGLWAVYKAVSMPTPDGRAAGLLGALTVGALPFIAGTVALAGAGVMAAVDEVRAELVIARADRETLAARDIAHRREERRQSPEFKAQVEAVKAEQAAARKDG
jgi:hypothetical protein